VSNPFDYVNSINISKKDIMHDDISEKSYPAFMVNRALSYFNDTVLYANEMNVNHHIDNKLQYHFLINIIRKKKRFSKWLKPREVDNLELIKEYYGYSNEKAKSVLPLFNNEQIELLKQRIYKGGKRKY
tara:strand:+ start:609 stop:995 length:387 start_codon:yes stop_codon:yes gene_type:complete